MIRGGQLFALLGWLFAMVFGARAGPHTIKIWEGDDGLPQNSIIAMTQTRDGYLWLGTLNGLVRFDGLEFTIFDENNTPGLSSSRIVHLFEDSRRRLWIGTESAGIALLVGGSITTPVELSLGGVDRRLVSACEDASGAVWLQNANGEIWRYADGRFTSHLLIPNEASARRMVIAETNGTVWLGTDRRQARLESVPEGTLSALPVNDSANWNRLEWLLASREGGYWRVADGMVQRVIDGRVKTLTTDQPWRVGNEFIRVTAACEDPRGSLYIGTQGAGVFHISPGGEVTSLSTNEGLSNNYILSLVSDREGTLWVGTDGGGLNCVKRQLFTPLEVTSGWVVQSVAEDADGSLWITSYGNGVGRWSNGNFDRVGAAQGLVSPDARSVLVDRERNVWIGTPRFGAYQWRDGQLRPAGSGVIHPVVQAIHQDRDGRLWFGTHGGLTLRDRNGWRTYTVQDGLAVNEVTAIADDTLGNLWVGTRGGGLHQFRDGRVQVVFRRTAQELPSDDITSLLADSDGVLWIGTGSGLARLHNGRWARFTTREGLTSNSIGYLLDDEAGGLWIGSNRGLMQVPKIALATFLAGGARTLPVRAYRRADGLPTGECTSGSQPGACRTRDGRLWFPTIKGLVSVHPASLTLNTNPPPVRIESVTFENADPGGSRLLRDLPDPLTISPASKERIEIRYTSLNLSSPEKARFKYRLEGHETEWFDAGNSRVATYLKLPPGDYRFVVKACNEDGVWNEIGASLALVVQPPFWRTWWFLAAVMGATLGLVAGIVYLISTQKLQRQLAALKQQEALERERARIARDIHDQLGASLTQVALLGELVDADKHSPEDIESHARQICQTARETTRTLDEIVWTVNPSNDTLEGLVNYICKYAQDYLAVAGLRYRLEIPPRVPDLSIPPEVRHNVFLAAKEAITNVVRHAHATSAWLRLELAPQRFTIEIADDGRGLAGMDAKRAATRSGLTNMRKRMEDIGGEFQFNPRPDGGTVVRLTGPLLKPSLIATDNPGRDGTG